MAKASRRALAKLTAARLSAPDADSTVVMKAVAAYLVDAGMADEADALMNDIAEEMFLQTGKLVVEVASARALTDEARKNLINFLQSKTGAAEVELYETVDEGLIGGLVARTPSAELDVSVRNTLRQLTGLAEAA